MIDTRELREGNMVSLQGGSIDEVTAIDGFSKKKAVRLAEVESWCYIYEIQPIPLTEAVLRAVGFQLFPEGYYFNFGCVVYKNFLRDGSGNWSGFNCNHSLLPLDSLHALQNVFYFLRGKELVINMEELKKAVG